MAKVVFTPNVQRHVACPEAEAPGCTVREVLDNVFAGNPQARGYVLDDQSALSRHITIFVDGQIIRVYDASRAMGLRPFLQHWWPKEFFVDGRMIRDRARLADPVNEASTIHVFQALSGG